MKLRPDLAVDHGQPPFGPEENVIEQIGIGHFCFGVFCRPQRGLGCSGSLLHAYACSLILATRKAGFGCSGSLLHAYACSLTLWARKAGTYRKFYKFTGNKMIDEK